jgi:hypothetical protein
MRALFMRALFTGVLSVAVLFMLGHRHLPQRDSRVVRSHVRQVDHACHPCWVLVLTAREWSAECARTVLELGLLSSGAILFCTAPAPACCWYFFSWFLFARMISLAHNNNGPGGCAFISVFYARGPPNTSCCTRSVICGEPSKYRCGRGAHRGRRPAAWIPWASDRI